ncbi:MAG: TlpA family protein disulfide reductase [Chloroflexota bacterium]
MRRPFFRRPSVLLAIIAVLAVFGWSLYRASTAVHVHHFPGPALTNPKDLKPRKSMLNVGQKAPNFAISGLNGQSYRLADHRGRPILLEFFADWCPHCQSEAPIIQRLVGAYKSRGIIFWSILASPYGPNFDNSFGQDTTLASAGDLRYFSRTYKEHIPQLVGKHFTVVNEYGVNSYPGIYIVNKRGIISYAQSGDQSFTQLDDAIGKALAGK